MFIRSPQESTGQGPIGGKVHAGALSRVTVDSPPPPGSRGLSLLLIRVAHPPPRINHHFLAGDALRLPVAKSSYIMMKVRFNVGDVPHEQPLSYRRKSPVQTRRDHARAASHRSTVAHMSPSNIVSSVAAPPSGMITRSRAILTRSQSPEDSVEGFRADPTGSNYEKTKDKCDNVHYHCDRCSTSKSVSRICVQCYKQGAHKRHTKYMMLRENIT